MIEPLVVFPRGPGDYLLLEGHVRLEILKSLGATEVKCLLSTDDEAYTYNRHVNHIPAIAQHFMLDALFAEKLDLLLKLRETTHLNWKGRYRAELTGQGVFPRPHQQRLPVWLGVGGTPASFARAGSLGLPLMIAIIGGSFEHFRPHVDLYRETGLRAGYTLEQLPVGVHAMGFVGETDAKARNAFFPGWSYMFSTIGRERGFSPPTRRQFDAMCGPEGAFLIGDPATVASKMLDASDALGGVRRITFQMSSAALETAAMKDAIELLGTEVAPIVRATAKTG